MADADGSDDAEQSAGVGEADVLADAEAEVALAESRAEQARARAEQLRRQARGDDEAAPPARTRRLRPPRLRPPTPKTVGIGAAVVIIAASLAADGYLVHQHLMLQREHTRATEAAAAARRGVEMMLSIDPAHVRDNVQTLVDNTTGELQSQLRATSTMLIQDSERAKVTTKATVQDVAVESTSGGSAVALVIAQSDTTDPDKSKRPPVFWRISVELARTDGQLKMSKVEFVQ